ncbi:MULTISPECIES: DUF4251 domain-containing protein [Flavobacterium]|uniref:DUF4251 domain-containing protein n=1 Tax=Flavobacterium anhuiense TaxID=459526 RepID=A0AAC9GIV6_9FLAO|nr:MULTISPECIES: DUF4251 domain-containing protein [Flavobacterium]AOC95935.1 hypothetical protein BB050_02841 [Flavobacterium anhuiense]EJF99815.1 hypothetical protein FF52_20150 [Flavobacterium sp. F52]SCY64548.1 protein of unknown function [Flavobacterium anhuiense]
MKTKLSVLLFLVSILNFSVSAQEKTKKELKQERELKKQNEIKALIDSQNFVFEAQKATPQGGRLIQLDYNTYFLKFKADSTTCDLPFFGRGYNVGYNSDGGIKFEGKPENIRVESKKNNTILKATVRGKSDVYDLLFSIFYNGSTTLSVSSNNRGPISYDGIIYAPKTAEKQ